MSSVKGKLSSARQQDSRVTAHSLVSLSNFLIEEAMEFHYTLSDLVLSVPEPNDDDNSTSRSSAFDQELRNRWSEAVDAGVCRYRLNLQNKKLPGKFGFIAQVENNFIKLCLSWTY